MTSYFEINNYEINKRLEEKAFQFTLYLSVSAIFLWLVWLLFDYIKAREIFVELLCLRILLSVEAVTVSILMFKRIINARIAQYLLYIPALTFLGFLFNYSPNHLLFIYMVSGIFMVIVSGFIFFIMPVKRAMFFGFYSLFAILFFQYLFPNHSLLELLLNGGILYVSMTAFIVAYTAVRYSSIKNGIKNDLIIEITNKKLSEQQSILKNKNKELENSLEEKKVLLKEIHHRVKNNLQIISSLLNLQQLNNNVSSQDVLISSQNRIHAMALLHEILYKSTDIETIDLPDYISLICQHLIDSINLPGRQIELNMNVASISLSIDKLIPLGLIVNELVTNSIKHAFKGDKGKINIELTIEDEQATLEICDNGIGLPKNYELTKKGQLGMRLVHGLANQLNGNASIVNKQEGICVRIDFKY